MEIVFRSKHTSSEVVTELPFLPVVGHIVFLFFSCEQKESYEYRVTEVIYSLDVDDNLIVIIVEVEAV